MASDDKPAADSAIGGAGLLVPLRSIFKGAGLLVLLLAITVGMVGKVTPELLLKVPNIGFILWAISGGPMPPFMRMEAWLGDSHTEWLKDDDVVVATGAKSGTTWLLYCTHQIRIKGGQGPKPFFDVSYTTPWPELLQTPGGDVLDQLRAAKNLTVPGGGNLADYWDSPEYPFRVWKSHFTPRSATNQHPQAVLPVRERPRVKFVAMARNGLDVLRSWAPFTNKHRDEFRALWGGFPPREEPSGSGVEGLLTAWLPGGMMSGFWHDYVSGWWPFRHDPNVLLLHYDEMVKDPATGIKRLAAFVGVDLSPNEFDTVLHKCSKEHMAKEDKSFRYLLPHNPSFGNGEQGIMELGGMVSQRLKTGVVSEKWDGKFTDAQKERWAAAEKEFFKDQKLIEWARMGGEL